MRQCVLPDISSLARRSSSRRELEKKRKAVLDFVNDKVSRFSRIKDVEIQKESFNKTATHKIRRFLYENN